MSGIHRNGVVRRAEGWGRWQESLATNDMELVGGRGAWQMGEKPPQLAGTPVNTLLTDEGNE